METLTSDLTPAVGGPGSTDWNPRPPGQHREASVFWTPCLSHQRSKLSLGVASSLPLSGPSFSQPRKNLGRDDEAKFKQQWNSRRKLPVAAYLLLRGEVQGLKPFVRCKDFLLHMSRAVSLAGDFRFLWIRQEPKAHNVCMHSEQEARIIRSCSLVSAQFTRLWKPT